MNLAEGRYWLVGLDSKIVTNGAAINDASCGSYGSGPPYFQAFMVNFEDPHACPGL